MNKVLLVGFKGNDNSSKLLLDKISNKYKLYLENDFKISEEQLDTELIKEKYDKIFIFGQKPSVKSIYIETCGKKDKSIYTDYDIKEIAKYLERNGLEVIISEDAGNYLCNNIYYHALKIKNQKCIDSKILFIHIPPLDNIENINYMADIFSKYIFSSN